MSNLLLPVLEAGRLRIILSLDQQRFLQISQRNTQLAHALNTLAVQPTDRAETMKIMRDQLISFEHQFSVTYMLQALNEAYRVGDRYVKTQYAGASAKVLESTASISKGGLITAQSVDDAAEKTMGIKIAAASGGDEREKLLNLESLIHQRMINQSRAVSVVSDAIHRARAGVEKS